MTILARCLEGKAAVITGAARGMGASHARVFASEGASVLIGDILDEPGEELAARLRGEGLDVTYCHLDVTLPTDWAAAVEFAGRHRGNGLVLVNNAGQQSFATAPDETVETYEQIIAVNQTGAFLGMKNLIPEMRNGGGGSIINISSTAGTRGDEQQFAYVASKAALLGMTRAAALDHAAEGIRVNAVCPGLIDSDMAYLYPKEEVARWLDNTPMRRAGRPDEISQVVLFLASDASSFVTGIALTADGGLTIGQQLPLGIGLRQAV